MVKSKRARDAAESVAEPTHTEQANGSSSATQDNKVKKRKRDVQEDPTEEDPVASETKRSKKEKKDKKDKKDKKSKKHDKESRKEKKEKRKDLQDLPEEVVEDAADEDEAPLKAEAKASNGTDGDAEAKRKEEKRARKQAKREEKKQRQQQAEQSTVDSTQKSNDKPAASATASSSTGQAGDNDKSEEDPIDLNDSSANGKKDRHIVFVGNLPFSATAASISAHFASLSPVAVRCLRNRDDPNPCRGIAFVEFSKVWHQRTCLDKFHHSTFDDGVSPPRKINVELTAGGGGKTRQRQEKIKEKNKKLDENRAKRIEREKVAKQEGSGADTNKGSHQEDSIHPSRRGRVPGTGW
ncbi:hypothetical protein NLU13_0279 [Sarocladium strictum]|uniref:RRM domain-containing protein n=1 Tax=Sarocladium strictum TaxID=5046 RepID=A0AA39GPI2_SARSR|nr:hypothetical protein NLU13_0279 [Sarocladium strictum]